MDRLWEPARPVLWLLGAIWAVSIANFATGAGLQSFGIVPRTPLGIVGIAAAPFIHGSLEHLVANTLPLLVLGLLVALYNASRFFAITLAIAGIGGLGVWVFGRPSSHIGASGLLFGYFGYLLAQGFYARSLTEIGGALLAIFLYSGMLFGAIPQDTAVSWESHLFGLFAGIAVARRNQLTD